MAGSSFGSIAHGRDNNFNLLRILAASSVLISHSFPLTAGPGTTEPCEPTFGVSLGTLAVQIFFAISGFFIAKSFNRRASTADFLVARVLRLYPGLLVSLALTAGILGPAMTVMPINAYLRDHQSWSFIPVNAGLRTLQETLPGVFPHTPFPQAVNGSLWTLYSEVKCYLLVALIGLVGLLRPRLFWIVVGVMVAYQVRGRWHDPFAHDAVFVALSLPFFVGTAIYVWRDRIPHSIWLAILLLALAAGTRLLLPAYAVVMPIALAYATLWLGYADLPALRRYNALGDYSYGLYIYAWPVQQTLVALFGFATPWALTAPALMISLGIAILSWRYVEEPALRHRHRIGTAIAGWLPGGGGH